MAIAVTDPTASWIEKAVRSPGVVLHPLTPDICIESTQLPGRFHGDPADQIIVATARTLAAALVTADKAIIDYVHVPTIW